MKAEIIAVGNEIMAGDIINTNVPYLSKKLTAMGYEITLHTDVPDEPLRIESVIRDALSRSNVVITIGGLGPTADDITAANIARALSRGLVFNKKADASIKAHFKKRKMSCPDINFKQAYIPEEALCLDNKRGTACGLIIRVNKDCFLIALPGHPCELEPMFDESVIPFLREKFKIKKIIMSRLIKTTGWQESCVAEKINNLLSLKGDVIVGSYPQPHEVYLKITAFAASEKEAVKKIDKLHRLMKQRLGKIIFGANEDTLESVLGGLLAKTKKTLSVVESCTGGLLSSRITDVAGSSKYFVSGITAYSNAEKKRLLLADDKILNKYGAVSPQAAAAMAKNMRRLSDTDYALSISGIAGPGGGSKSKPVGLVYIALADRKKSQAEKFMFPGSRQMIKLQATQAALDMLRKKLM